MSDLVDVEILQDDLFDYCMEQETVCMRMESSEPDHARKAQWHQQRWVWLNRALRAMNNSVAASEKWGMRH